MEVWGWILVYALGLTLFQFLLYRYLVNRGETLTESLSGGRDLGFEYERGRSASLRRERTRDRLEADTRGVPPGRLPNVESGDGRICPNCGAENEPDTTYDRCWNCTGEL